MDRDSLNYYLLGGQANEAFVAALIWGFIGLIFSLAVELMRSQSKIKRSGGFSVAYWLSDNFWRIVSSFLAVLIGASFGDYIIGEHGNGMSCFLGFSTDKVIEALIKFRSNFDVSKLSNLFGKKE